ncbi:hypothetical protein CEJ90_15545, partial [Staphylococcus aureus]
VIQILKLLEHVDLPSMGPRSVDYLHHLIQAMHLAYSDRAQYLCRFMILCQSCVLLARIFFSSPIGCMTFNG